MIEDLGKFEGRSPRRCDGDKLKVKISCLHQDGWGFVVWLNDTGFNATLSPAPGNFINGMEASTDKLMSSIFQMLWETYREVS